MWAAHPLGKGASASGFSPKAAHALYEDLSKARDGLILTGDTHMLFLVAPEPQGPMQHGNRSQACAVAPAARGPVRKRRNCLVSAAVCGCRLLPPA